MADHHEYCTGGFSPDDIVITGIAGRFPHCKSLVELNDALLNQKNLLIQTEARFKKGADDLPFGSCGNIEDIDKFDASFFGFTAVAANSTDPLQRMLLESSYECMVDAGYEPMSELRGENIGVYTAVSNDDAKVMYVGDSNNITPYVAAGYLRCMLANRCSYVFDFHGPSYTMDTACSSSAVALHNAVMDIAEGRVRAALVNSGELVLAPSMCATYLKCGILSPTAESNPFEARANGFVRSEAVVTFFIQKASDARRVYAKIVGVKQAATGFVPEGVYVPSHKEEVRLFNAMLKETGLKTTDIQFIESHGTGTKVGDPIEVKSLETVYCQGRDTPLYIGSVKSNLGHSEAAAGQSGILKAIFAFETGTIAPNLGFRDPNPNCDALVKGTIKVVSEPTPLTSPYIVANSFGFGGCIVQTILKKNPIEFPSYRDPEELPRLVLYSATTEEAVLFLFEYVENHPELRAEFFALLNKLPFCSTVWKPFRGYALFHSEHPAIHVKNALREKKREVWYVMTGMGSQWPGMGLEMMQIRAFADSMRKSTAVLKPLGVDLLDLLRKDRSHLTTDRNIVPAFVSIAAIQIALVDVLRSLQIEPDGIVGHSVGELLCAYADGCCTAEQTVLSAYWRGRCVEEADLLVGAMAAVGLPWDEAVRRCPEGVYPACDNAGDSVTISGLKEPLEKFVAQLQSENIFARVVNCYGYAFHCQQVWPAAPKLRRKLTNLIRSPKPRTKRWISSSYPEEEWETDDCKLAGPEYFTHNLMSTVRFKDVLKRIPSDAITIEIGPHFLLQSILKRSIGSDAIYIGLMKRNDDNNVGFFLEALGKLYVEDVNPKIENLYRPVKFPVPRGTPFISDLIQWDHSQSFVVPKWSPITTSFSEVFNINTADRYLLDHFIDGRALFPATGYVRVVWQAFVKKMAKKALETNVVVEDFKIHRATMLDPSKSVSFDVNLLSSDGRFEILESGSLVSSGRIYEIKDPKFVEPPPTLNRESSTYISGEDLYNELKIAGYEYGPAFRNLLELSIEGNEGVVDWKDNWIPFLDSLLLFFMFANKKSGFVLPTGALSFTLCPGLLKEAVEENQSQNKTGIPVNFYADSKICRSAGVEIRNLEVDFAPQHAKSDNSVLEQYTFFPYVNKYLPSAKNQSFEKYMIACNKLIDKLQSKLNKNLNHGKFSVKKKIDFDIDDYIKDFSEGTMLSRLKQITGDNSKDSMQQSIHDMSQKFIQEIGKDFVNTLLIDENSLRVMFDIMFENIFKKIRVLEIQNTSFLLLPAIVELMEKYSLLKFKSKSLICKNENEVDKEMFNKSGIQLYMPPDLTKLVQEKSQGLIISAISISTVKEAREHIRLLSSAVEQQGFILLLHKTSILPPENLLMIFSEQIVDVIPPSTLECWFQEENLVVVSKIYDDICSSLYLLKPVAETKERKVTSITESLAWFDDLKSSVCKTSEISWIVSEGNPDSGIIGMINCLKNEPGGDKIRCVFIPDKNKEKNLPPPFSFDDPFYQDILKKDLLMNVYKNGSWGSFRHVSIEKDPSQVEVENCHATVKRIGDLASIEMVESGLHYMDVPEEDHIHVYYSALNFRDIMLATGKLSQNSVTVSGEFDDAVIGFEYSGRDKFGCRLAGLCRSRGLGTAVRCDRNICIPVPDHWSMEDAATVPVVYFTNYYAMLLRGKLLPGESILIHSGTGGIGQSAINIALSMNCEIFTTVGSEEKRQYLMKKFPTLKKENIGCSRDTSFENMVMKQTKGKGVNVVLNSLADDKFLASVRCLGDGGRFLELGKYDIAMDHKLGMKAFEKNISFHSVQSDNLQYKDDSAESKVLQEMMLQGIRNGAIKPLDRTVFQRDEMEKALRYMAGGTHVGKVLIKIRDEEKERKVAPRRLRLCATPVTYFYARKVYIIIGGLGGFGIEVAKWLLDRGAKNLVLTTRYGARTPYHHFCLGRWREKGHRVVVSTRNVSVREEAARLLREVSEMGPVGGIFNSAVVLRDSFLENMDCEGFQEVCAPKADATRDLDALSRSLCPELDHFVCFSSISCGRGNAGQANYGFANSVMERVCERRRADGLPGLAIQWGIIGDVGVVHRHMGDDAMIAGVCAQRVKSCLEILNVSSVLKHPVVCSYVVKDSSGRAGDKGDVLQQLARIFGLKDPSEFNSIRSFSEMGVDSIAGIEVKHLLETTCDTTFTMQEIQELKIEDVKALLEKAESQKKSTLDTLVTTGSAKLPKSFVHSKPVESLNDIKSGTPLFVLDVDSGDLEHLRILGRAMKRPAYALLLTKEAPTTDVQALATWFLQKILGVTHKESDLLSYKTASIIALEMISQIHKTPYKIRNLISLDGIFSLLETLNRETKKKDLDLFCEFLEDYIPSVRNRIRDMLSNANNVDQKLRIVVDLFTKSSKETVNKTEISDIISSHIKKLQLFNEYEFKEKLHADVLIIEDSSKLLPNDVAEVKKLLTEVCTGKVVIQRIPDVCKFTEENVQKIVAALDSN